MVNKFTLFYNFFLEPSQLFADTTKKISHDFVLCKIAVLPEPVSNVTLIPKDAAITFAKEGQKLTKFELESTAEVNQVSIQILNIALK